jgi:GNAT superfamily N-acetyltransferase
LSVHEPVEIEPVQPERTEAFRREHEREALSTEWKFRIVWHEQRHELAALDGDRVIGVLGLRIAASLAHVESLIVEPERRRSGIGRRLLERAEILANYYNCHKVTLEAPAGYVLRSVRLQDRSDSSAAHVEARRRDHAQVSLVAARYLRRKLR